MGVALLVTGLLVTGLVLGLVVATGLARRTMVVASVADTLALTGGCWRRSWEWWLVSWSGG
jgi:hypothetical protein